MTTMTADQLEQITGGTGTIQGSNLVVDMSEYHCTYYSMAMGMALLYKGRGYDRLSAIEAVYGYYANMNIIMLNLDQCITQEEWDRF